MPIETTRLRLWPLNAEQLLAQLAGVEPFEKATQMRTAPGFEAFAASAEVSPAYVERLRASGGDADRWVEGFAIQEQASAMVIGVAGFKAPPGPDGMVELAYGIVIGRQNQGFATEVAIALARHALLQAGVQTVIAHTLPGVNASTRVLEKSGFVCLGEVLDPEDGPVWRWRKEGHD